MRASRPSVRTAPRASCGAARCSGLPGLGPRRCVSAVSRARSAGEAAGHPCGRSEGPPRFRCRPARRRARHTSPAIAARRTGCPVEPERMDRRPPTPGRARCHASTARHRWRRGCRLCSYRERTRRARCRRVRRRMAVDRALHQLLRVGPTLRGCQRRPHEQSGWFALHRHHPEPVPDELRRVRHELPGPHDRERPTRCTSEGDVVAAHGQRPPRPNLSWVIGSGCPRLRLPCRCLDTPGRGLPPLQPQLTTIRRRLQGQGQRGSTQLSRADHHVPRVASRDPLGHPQDLSLSPRTISTCIARSVSRRWPGSSVATKPAAAWSSKARPAHSFSRGSGAPTTRGTSRLPDASTTVTSGRASSTA